MTMKSIFFVVAVAALVGAAIASCPNACSGHGSCGNHDRCNCYANFVGGDCSEKACPSGVDGTECSGRGTCDRGAGSCECADGYSGASCQRISCPNDCSSKGSCDTSTGRCNCAGGYSGNGCGVRLCPKGDDPLTHEVENSGDGSASQEAEVQTVSFNGGRGLGGTATLTYKDLYGQSWTTRPFAVGGDQAYRLEIAYIPGGVQGTSQDQSDIVFTYNGASSTDILVNTYDAKFAYDHSSIITAEDIRVELVKLFGAYAASPHVGKDRANTIYVRKHNSATSAKLGGTIYANARITFDIYLPIDMSSHDDNGGLLSALTVAFKTTPDTNTAEINLYSLGDRSDEIEHALTSLPNQVIPSATVSKVDVTDSDTNSGGSNGNTYSQSYAITFSDASNAGDQNMLSCNAAPCDESGCINRGPGVSEVKYMHHDAENAGEGINFVNKGYFIMDIGQDGDTLPLSAGSIKIMWDTGAGIDSAIFATVATAAEVQTALRTITGWEAVTVELWGSKANVAGGSAAQILTNHQFKVTFAAGYDDLGKSPTFYTMATTDGAYAAPNPTDTRARVYDQRFSNSVWLGKTTGFVQCIGGGTSCELAHTDIDGLEYILTGSALIGDVWVTSGEHFGTGGLSGAAAGDPAGTGTEVTLAKDTTAMGSDIGGSLGVTTGKNFAYLKEGKTSVQTSDYFAVGASIEVLGTTWDDGAVGTDVDIGVLSNNKYRKFKVTGHVTNEFNREFAKLDSFPADDGVAMSGAAGSCGDPAADAGDGDGGGASGSAALCNGLATCGTGDNVKCAWTITNAHKPDYNLKLTSNNGTVHTYPSLAAKITLQEVQVVVIGTGLTTHGQTGAFKLYYKGEESQDMTAASTAAQVAEEISGFSALSGAVTVAAEGSNFVVTFDQKDGDVAQLTANSGSGVSVVTREHGWSIEGAIGLGLDTMQAGGIINVTAAEVCTFTMSHTDGTYYFCYDGNCGTTTVTGTTDADWKAAVESIKDDNGDNVLTVSATASVITMPLGKSCDGLELRVNAPVSTTSIAKTVDKHNNGKQFRITRSFMASKVIAGTLDAVATFSCESTAAGGCHEVLDDVDTILISQVSGCDVLAAADGGVYPVARTVDTNTRAGGAPSALVLGTDLTTTASTHTSACVYRLARHVITLDSAPTASAVSKSKTFEYTSPVGSCSVAETTKGTFESYECSNRGACDGKSGLCACYEGYSGQSCQTQTVLV